MITRSGFEVAENEGLALVSSNAFTTAWACLATADAEALLAVFDVAGALDLEAFEDSDGTGPFAPQEGELLVGRLDEHPFLPDEEEDHAHHNH